MWCWRTRPHLTALADGELDPRREALVRAHLATCPACAGLYAGIEAGIALHREYLRQVCGPADVAVDSLLRSVRGRLDEREERTENWLWRPVLVSAVAAGLVAALFLVRSEPMSRPESGRVARVAQKPAAVAPQPAGVAEAPGAEQARAEEGTPGKAGGGVDLEEPRDLLAENPDFFRNYPLFERLDAIEHFETVQNEAGDVSSEDPPNG